MRKLSKYEKETIINWNEGENIASIYTFNASLKRRLEDFSRKYPLLCSCLLYTSQSPRDS